MITDSNAWKYSNWERSKILSKSDEVSREVRLLARTHARKPLWFSRKLSRTHEPKVGENLRDVFASRKRRIPRWSMYVYILSLSLTHIHFSSLREVEHRRHSRTLSFPLSLPLAFSLLVVDVVVVVVCIHTRVSRIRTFRTTNDVTLARREWTVSVLGM